MPFSAAASVRGRPSSTNASAKMRRTCVPSRHLADAARSSAAVKSSRVRDATIAELRDALGARGHWFGYGTWRRFFARHRITRKKRLATRQSKSARTS